MRELGARLDLDIGGKAAQHVIEQGNLLIGIAARAGRKQVGDPINDLEAVLGGRAGDRLTRSSRRERLSASALAVLDAVLIAMASSLQLNEFGRRPRLRGRSRDRSG